MDSEERWNAVSQDVIASADEIKEAIENMSATDLYRLEQFAKYRIRGLGRRALGRSYEDLIKEAMVATLGGNRNWKIHKVGFVGHMMAVVRSISSHWKEKAYSETYLESEFSDENKKSILETPSQTPSAETVLSAKEKLQTIYRHFSGDEQVSKLFSSLEQGLTSTEAQETFGLSKKQYEAAVKRLRRGLNRMKDLEAT